MGRPTLTPEQKAAAKAFRESPEGIRQKLLKNELKNFELKAKSLVLTQPELAEVVNKLVLAVNRKTDLKSTMETSPEQYVETLKTQLTSKVDRLRKDLSEAEAELATVDVNAAKAALQEKLSTTETSLTEAKTAFEAAVSPKTLAEFFPEIV